MVERRDDRSRHGLSMLVAMTVAATAVGCGADEAMTGSVVGATASVSVLGRDATGPVLEDFRQRFLLTGELEAARGAPIVVPVNPSWQVALQWMIKEGSRVEAGDRVAELDTAPLMSELEERKLARDGAENALVQKESEVAGQIEEKSYALEKAVLALEKARRDAEIAESVLARRQYQENQLALEEARVALEKARADFESYRESSRAELAVARIELEAVERQIRETEAAIETMTLTAPASGIVVIQDHPWEGRKWEVGDEVWVGMEVMKIPDLDAMGVVAQLSDVDDGRITPGMQVVSVLDTYPDRAFTGTIVEISPIARESGRRSERRHFDVRIALDAPDPDIMRPGMSVRVAVETATRRSAVTIPRSRLRFDDDGGVRAVLPSGEVRSGLTLGPCTPQTCVVESGLTVSDRPAERGGSG